MNNRHKGTKIIAFLFILALGIIMISPLVWLFFASFKSNNEIFLGTRSFTVSVGSNTVRMEFGVFGVLMTSFPSCRATLLLIESVRF